jgi:small-conductance mechanosensitive channel
MEILSLNFAIFVFKLSICIIPIALGIRLFAKSQEQKIETRKKLSSKLLGDSNLLKQSVYNFGLYFIASISILTGLFLALLFLLSVM